MTAEPHGQQAASIVGDMSPTEFREHGHRVVEWISEYLENPDAYPVLSRVQPGEIRDALPPSAPETGEPFTRILDDFESVIVPGVTHWNHPAFFAYFSITGSAPGILGEMLAAALNVNGMLWKTSPSAAELEEVAINWLRQLMGLPATFDGVIYDTASMSSLVAIAGARDVIDPEVRDRGLTGRNSPRLRLYCSDQAHSSIDKAAITLGLGTEAVRKIGTDADFRIDVRELVDEIEKDRSLGFTPFCVVGVAGTTSTTSVDPLPHLADVCERFGLWFHVDAAYGGAAAIVPELRWVLEGADRADSLVVNPHKWLFTPVDLSVLLCRRLDVIRRAFSLVPDYLQTDSGDEVRNYMDYGPQLGRRFRALKLWFVLRTYGREGLVARLRHHVELARRFAACVEGESSWELSAPVPLSTVCFRAVVPELPDVETDALNERIMNAVNATGRVYLSHTRLHGRFVLRLAIGNLRTTEDHVYRAWALLQEALAHETAQPVRRDDARSE